MIQHVRIYFNDEGTIVAVETGDAPVTTRRIVAKDAEGVTVERQMIHRLLHTENSDGSPFAETLHAYTLLKAIEGTGNVENPLQWTRDRQSSMKSLKRLPEKREPTLQFEDDGDEINGRLKTDFIVRIRE